MNCWCGHGEEKHKMYFKSIWSPDMNEVMGCSMCGDNHYFDSVFWGFLQHGVENA